MSLSLSLSLSLFLSPCTLLLCSHIRSTLYTYFCLFFLKRAHLLSRQGILRLKRLLTRTVAYNIHNSDIPLASTDV